MHVWILYIKLVDRLKENDHIKDMTISLQLIVLTRKMTINININQHILKRLLKQKRSKHERKYET